LKYYLGKEKLKNQGRINQTINVSKIDAGSSIHNDGA
jgi:hypothetical protein